MVKSKIFVVNSARQWKILVLAGLVGALASALTMSAEMLPRDAAVELPEFIVRSPRVANQEAAASVDMPVSALRFEPRVDVQGRNLVEAQADIAIRGGIFENTGFRLGGIALTDPQTGHYFAEIPVPTSMLAPPRVLTGATNAALGLNASVGTIAYDWAPVTAGGRATVGVGQNGLNRQALNLGLTRALPGSAGATLGAEVDLSRSESDGTVPFGDHDFSRAAIRLQRRDARAQTDLFAGYQSKFFGWPNLYTPFGVNESEDLQTLLVVASHTWRDDAGNQLQAGAFYRRNDDDYEFNRANPGQFNPYQHTTWLKGLSVSGRILRGDLALAYAAHLQADELRSTALTAGRYRERTITKLAFMPTWSERRGDDLFTVGAGAGYDDSNRAGGTISPSASASWQRGTSRLFAEYSEATQLPTYTALNSPANAGLFRGNANLGRSRSRNGEIGAAHAFGAWSVEAAVFRRWDDALVDWTFNPSILNAARTANAVDVVTTGLEVLATWRTTAAELVLGYTWLEKSADYGAAGAVASFYALNFPRHRLTAALTWRLGSGWELRLDNEYRVQEENVLRTNGDTALISNWGLHYVPPKWRDWEFSIGLDNVWDNDFQEVPAVPASRRQLSFGVAHRW